MMIESCRKNNKIAFLEERVKHLEDVERFVIDAIELASSLGDFQSSINKLCDISRILEETGVRIQALIPFECKAFFLVDEGNHEFVMKYIDTPSHQSYIQNEIDYLIEDGTFAWVLREKRPIIVSCSDHRKIMLHVMATTSRIRGVYVGLMCHDEQPIPIASLSILSIILLNSANAIESFELYGTIREINSNLERIDNYRFLFNAAPDGVEVLDAFGNILDCNESQMKLLGYGREQLLGNSSSNFLSEQNQASFAGYNESLRESGYWEGEVVIISANGSAIPVWRKEKALYDKEGKYVGAVVYNRDISVRKKEEEEKQMLEARLKRAEKMEALGFLAGGVAHDLNNILGGLVSYPELILMKLSKDSPLRKSIMTIQKSGQKAAAIVEDLLTLARRGIFEPQVINLNEVITEYFKTPEHEKMKEFHSPFKLTVDLDPNLMKIKGSPVHLSKMIMNLMSNAVEAVSDGGEINIRTEYKYLDAPIKGYDVVEEGDYVVLTASDNGKGISANDLDKIFEPFYTKKVMGKSGTGLGLAVVWGTVKDHQGYIDVQSEVGKGSTFSIYLPVTIDESSSSQTKISIDQYMGNGETILVVDDVIEQRELAMSILDKLGYNVFTVSDGLDAVEFVRVRPVDLVILDMIMDPGIDGLETYKRILKISPYQKAIIVSGFSETEKVRQAQQLGAGAYIRKPYRLENIGMAIKNELEKAGTA
ncbi:MAG: ATP-binding protein [Syntrophales bacterium]|nr:ATP-binding protein [Syntrophales bacterium]